MESVCTGPSDDAAEEKVERLNDFLLNLVESQHARKHHGDLFREVAREQAKQYLGATWMQTPWLTAYILRNLLVSVLVSLRPVVGCYTLGAFEGKCSEADSVQSWRRF